MVSLLEHATCCARFAWQQSLLFAEDSEGLLSLLLCTFDRSQQHPEICATGVTEHVLEVQFIVPLGVRFQSILLMAVSTSLFPLHWNQNM